MVYTSFETSGMLTCRNSNAAVAVVEAVGAERPIALIAQVILALNATVAKLLNRHHLLNNGTVETRLIGRNGGSFSQLTLKMVNQAELP